MTEINPARAIVKSIIAGHPDGIPLAEVFEKAARRMGEDLSTETIENRCHNMGCEPDDIVVPGPAWSGGHAA